MDFEHLDGPALQQQLSEAAQNGSDEVVKSILVLEKASLIDVNAHDEAGSTPLTYASCFGHEAVVAELLRFNADPNTQDKNEWTPLMWAVNNNHLPIVKLLLAAEADTEVTTSSGRRAFDVPSSESATYMYLASSGYVTSNVEPTFYQPAVDPLTEAELDAKFTLDLQESADTLGFQTGGDPDEEAVAVLSAPVNTKLQIDFDWQNFKVKDSFALPMDCIPQFLDLVITDFQPSLQKSQPPLSANALFLAARYLHYCGTSESFFAFTSPICRRIELCVQGETRKGDLAYLTYWLANVECLLYYLRKDSGMAKATANDLQMMIGKLVLQLSDQIVEATQNLLNPLIPSCLLNYDSIPEYGKVEYRDEWKLFKSTKRKEESLSEVAQRHMLPPSYETLMKHPGPQRVTSVLSSLLFLFQIFGVHPVTQAQITAKLLYFLNYEMFNKIVKDRKYLNRRRAMQIRLNISVVEDWCRNHNFRPETLELSKSVFPYKSLIDIGRTFLAPLVQILAWLQTFSGFGNDFTNVISTLQELKALNPKQLLKTATNYRFETRESPLSKDYKLYLQDLAKHYDRAAEEQAIEETVRQRHTKKQNDLVSLDEEVLNPPKTYVLASYELPVADDILLDEELHCSEHVPCLKESEDFWGEQPVSGNNEALGGRHAVPFIPQDLSPKLAKMLNMEDEVKDEVEEMEEPEVATRPPITDELDDSLAAWEIDEPNVW